MPKALIVEDDPNTLDALCEFVEGAGFVVRAARTLAEARTELGEGGLHLVLTDVGLPDGSGLELMADLASSEASLDLVFVTGEASLDAAVDAFRGGAVDYLTKPISLERLRKILLHVHRKAQLQQTVEDLRQQLRELGRFGRLVGTSPQMQQLYDQMLRVAPTEASVFILGDTGTGKELVAETVHSLSRRAAGPFVPVNCGAMVPELIESELFGHEAGSFTGASKRHHGLFERAAGGSVFLDEVTEMPLALQVKLLRVLESRMLQRVGGDTLLPVDVRILAATNRDPHKAVADQVLREDLLYRLLGFPLQIPPLEKRAGDIGVLAQHFLDELNRRGERAKRLSPEALGLLERAAWPGNVRELRNVVERAFILSGDVVDAQAVGQLPMRRAEPAMVEAPSQPTGPRGLAIRRGMSVEAAERVLLLETLRVCDGNKQAAARQLGISLKTLYNRLHEYRDAGLTVDVALDDLPPGDTKPGNRPSD